MGLVVHTSLDIVYLVGILCYYCSDSNLIYYNLIIYIFRYLFGTLNIEIALIS